MHGKDGSSSPLPLGDGPENFEQGEEDVLTVSLPRLGAITAITVSHDGNGPYPEWHLDRIEMSNKQLGEQYTFPHSQWIGREGEKTSVRLEAVRQVVSGGVNEVSEEVRGPPSPVSNDSEDYSSDQFESPSDIEEEEEEETVKQGVSELDSSITNEV